MALKKKGIVGKAGTRRIGLASPMSPLQLVQTPLSAGKPRLAESQPVANDSGDPTGIKSYIAFSVAHGLYPHGSGVDPDQDISDDVALNAATIAAEINNDAHHSAVIHQLTWEQVTVSQVSKLKTVSDLVDLVKAHLSDSGDGGST